MQYGVKANKVLCFFILIGLTLSSVGQTISQLPVEFAYDAAGNRTFHHVIVLDRNADRHGKVVKSGTETIEDNNTVFSDWIQRFKVYVYPNPTQGYVFVEIPYVDSESVHTIRIFDSNGRKIYEYTACGKNFEIDLSNQPSGFYIVNISIDGNNATWKIVKK
ncbi:MAG: T9SS type A sorting domain-containing protein [Bacteroidales bacterium]|nr:T9SS type A sorting domain-containing protein [Bacteroidales bacterium]